jgi:hypothetical protein
MRPPDLSEVREALGCVVGDTDRAGDIVNQIRDHMKKAPPRKAQFDLNEAIDEVIVLGRSAVIKNGVSVQTRLSEGLFPVHGDRVQSAWEWGCRFPGLSSTPMAAGCGRRRMNLAAPYFSSPCPPCIESMNFLQAFIHRMGDVRYWHLADIPTEPLNVRFRGVKRTSRNVRL